MPSIKQTMEGNTLSQLHKKQLEEFDELFGTPVYDENLDFIYSRGEKAGCDDCLFNHKEREKHKSHLTQSTLSTLQGVWQMLEEGKNCKQPTASSSTEEEAISYGYNQAITDTQKKIEEEIIKIRENV